MSPLRTGITAFAFALALAAAGFAAGPAAAQDAAKDSGDRLQGLIQELKGQLERGEKERLIDPWFLRDLRQTLRAYEYPWSKRRLGDDFSGRGPQPDPPWRVTAGEFLIDWRFGLRSVIEHRAPQPQAQPQEQAKKPEGEAVKQLFGQILKQAIQGEEEKKPAQAPAPAAAPGFAAVVAPVAISNAFALRLEMTSRSIEGGPPRRFEFGPFQGADATAGYRLAYNPGAAAGTPSLELVRLGARGTSATVEVYDKPLALEDGKAHVFEWTRDSAGAMVVRLDGAQVMGVTDRGYRDPFDGIAVVNSGGDYALRSITLDGPPYPEPGLRDFSKGASGPRSRRDRPRTPPRSPGR